jgi:probable F420-dependent oxidoreductase
MKVDGGVPIRLADVPDAVGTLERRGYAAGWCGELDHDPFLPLVLAAEHSTTLEVGTCIAVAFARNPMNVANLAWDLQSYSGGRFVLGLGTQIRPHIERRFGMPWGPPVAKMREFVLAVRAIWSAWQEGTPLRFEGEHYTHTLMTPMFSPEPLAHAFPPIFLAAVGEVMTELCGEVADGLHAHAFTTERYLREVTTVALHRGLARSGRVDTEVQLSCPVFVVTGEDEEQLVRAGDAMRRQLAFYGSTPAYRPVLELHGWGDLQTELHALSRRGDWDQMGALVDDDVLSTFAVVAPLDELGAKVHERYAGVVDRILLGLPAGTSDERAADVLAAVRG